jgi:hypothetical membrane protein
MRQPFAFANTDFMKVVSVQRSLRCGIAVPFLYFGAQLVGTIRNPTYDSLRQAVSDLGGPGMNGRWWFNAAAISTGVAMLLAVPGLFAHWSSTKTNTAIISLAGVGLFSVGASSVTAGVFPLPSRYHGGPTLFTAGMLAVPLLMFLVVWSSREQIPWMRGYGLLNLALFAVLLVFVVSLGGVSNTEYDGLLQRVLATTVFVPPAVVSWGALRALTASPYQW